MQDTSRLSVAGVILDTFGILGRRAAALAALAALLLGAPQAISWVAAASLGTSPGARAGLLVAAPVADAVFSAVFRAAVSYAALSALDGRPRPFGAALARGGKLSLGMLLLGIRSGVSISVGTLLLVVPGLMLFCSWAVIVPAYVEEGGGGTAAFARSRMLTYGHRWRILGLALVFALASAAVYLPTLLLGDPTPAAGWFSAPATAQALAVDALSLLGDVGFVALYVALRRLDEGLAAGDLAEAFA